MVLLWWSSSSEVEGGYCEGSRGQRLHRGESEHSSRERERERERVKISLKILSNSNSKIPGPFIRLMYLPTGSAMVRWQIVSK